MQQPAYGPPAAVTTLEDERALCLARLQAIDGPQPYRVTFGLMTACLVVAAFFAWIAVSVAGARPPAPGLALWPAGFAAVFFLGALAFFAWAIREGAFRTMRTRSQDRQYWLMRLADVDRRMSEAPRSTG